jgi:hypothetical protein
MFMMIFIWRVNPRLYPIGFNYDNYLTSNRGILCGNELAQVQKLWLHIWNRVSVDPNLRGEHPQVRRVSARRRASLRQNRIY